MKLREITLTNFRCFECCKVPLSPDLTVLVGINGAGKTAILDGIAVALGRILARLPRVGRRNLRPEDIRQDAGGVQARFVGFEAISTTGIRWGRIQRRDATKQTAVDVPDGIGDAALYAEIDPVIYEINEGRDAFLPVFASYGVSRAVLELPERRRNFPTEFRRFDALDGALESGARFRDLVQWFYAAERDAAVEMLHFGERVTSPAPLADIAPGEMLKNTRSFRALNAVRDAITKAVPGYGNPRMTTNPLRLVLSEVGDTKNARPLALQTLSDGNRTMLALVMDFARRLALANPHLTNPLEAEAILMIDEIDLHLHPVWQQTVIPSIRRAFPNTQLIVSTHSPQVLTTVPAEKILIVDREGVRGCDVPTYGARSSDLVEEVLGLPGLRPPGNNIATTVSQLFQALDAGDLPKAKTLRMELEKWAKGFPEPDLVRADLLIRRLEFNALKAVKGR